MNTQKLMESYLAHAIENELMNFNDLVDLHAEKTALKMQVNIIKRLLSHYEEYILDNFLMSNDEL